MSMTPARQCIDVGIVVRDIKESLDFYHGLLGLEKLEELDVPFGRMHRLRFGDSFVKLVVPLERPPASPLAVPAVSGLRYLTFPVSNLEATCEKCEKAGVTFDLQPTELMPNVFVAMFRDPDGNLVELVQRR
jgi:catechol 2,3-dioxygenase-like lactoylglutathione lyase family enzyme